MKIKILTYTLGAIVPAGIAAGVIVPITLNANKKFESVMNVSRFNTNAEFIASEFKMDQTIENGNDIIATANQADINLFWTGSAVTTFTEMTRIAMLTALSTEVHFLISRGERRVAFANNVDVEKFQAYLNANIAKPDMKPTIEVVGNDITGLAVDHFKKLIEANPNKKINIWWNGSRLSSNQNGTDSNKILELAGYKNVKIQGIEDGTNNGVGQLNAMQNKDLYDMDKIQTVEDYANYSNPNAKEQWIKDIHSYFAPAVFSNVYQWFSNISSADVARNPRFTRFKSLNLKGLEEAIFNTKDHPNTPGSTPQRLFTYWPSLSGYNWKATIDLINNAKKQFQNKKTLLIIGNYRNDSNTPVQKFIQDIYTKYSNDYVIFYKGHPGHMENTDFVKSFATSNQGIYALDPQLRSEEFTMHHNLIFDGLAVVGHTGAMDGFTKADYPDLSNTLLSILPWEADANGEFLTTYSGDVFNNYLNEFKRQQPA